MAYNVLLLTLDDMNYNSHDFLRHDKETLTPYMDELQRDALYFANSHVTIGVCQPSRSALMTGRYPHRNGARGFEAINEEVETLSAILHRHGYFTAIIGKVPHLAPLEAFCWDRYIHTLCAEESFGRDPASYYRHTKQMLAEAAAQGKPFFLMANSHDPHRPFAGSRHEEKAFGRNLPASRVYTADDVAAPGFLPDLPDIRTETAQYLTSVHRADESVGAILRALKEAGQYEQTIIMVLSDNGMAMPFAKANCYYNSTKSPYLMRWPGHTGKRRTEALVSGIDYMPTILDMLNLPCPEGIDGHSMTHLFEEDSDKQYDDIYTLFFKTAKNPITRSERHFPMRCVQDTQYAYIYNSWHDGETQYIAESMAGLTYAAMEAAAQTDESVAQRVKLYRYRVREELYDLVKDPDALHNLADDPAMAGRLAHYRARMESYLRETGDELLPTYLEQIHGKDVSK